MLKSRSNAVFYHQSKTKGPLSSEPESCPSALTSLLHIFVEHTPCRQRMWHTQAVWRFKDSKDSLQQLRIGPLEAHVSVFSMFHVCLGVFCRRHLFQRTKRSLSIKKKRSRKSLSKTKAKPLNFLALKKSPARKFAPKKKRPMPGYQATAPARPRGDFRVKLLWKEEQIPSRSSCLKEKICDGRPRAPCPPL